MKYNEPTFTRDAAVVTFKDDSPGITVDDDGDVEFDWDEVETVRIDDPPHAEAFKTKEFYRLPATVARPIPQPYQFGEDVYWLKKPREELKKAAWSLDNAPWTMGHPDTGMVKDAGDIRGFWKDPRYIDGLDDLDSDLHVPVNDDEAKDYVEEHGDVSVGFYNKNVRIDQYDGVVGGEDDGGIDLDGYQVDMYFDHCASVGRGRCPSGSGCGLDSTERHGHMTFISASVPNNINSEGDMDYEIDGYLDEVDESPLHFAEDYRDEDGRYFAVSPSEGGGEPKFPINSCSDVSDAWKLRNHGDMSISVETLAERIKRRASALDCENPDPDAQDSVDSTDHECGCSDESDLALGKSIISINE